MSHNTSALAPYITEHTTALSTAGAGQSLVIQGFGLGLSTVVDIPSALGVETARAFTKTGATAGVLTITLTVAAIPDPAANRSIAISMGGVPCQGVGVTGGAITITHGFIPTDLSSLVAWYDAADASTITKDSSDLVGQWDDKSGNGFHAVQGTESAKPKYFASGGGIGQTHLNWGHNHPTRTYLQVAGPTTWAPLSSGGHPNTSVFAVLHWPGTQAGDVSDLIRWDNNNAFGIRKAYSSTAGSVIYRGGWQCAGGTPSQSLPSKFLTAWMYTDSGFVTRLNGAVDDTDSTSPGTSALTDSNWIIGSNVGNGPHLEVSELVIFGAELTGTDLANVEEYLRAKWSIWT